ncbi:MULTISPECIES: hypothetical protein [unclassified Paraflavitalea]|uniref:hypothetical protein n=1 Tax=unclassified Paraflavitalea TaxID=2798305 RepID=UPI003D328D18
MIKFLIPILLILCSIGCGNKIETADTLSKNDIDRLRSLKLLDQNERLFQFYSEFKNSVAGNFYTDKRIASYWLDEHDQSKNKIQFAFYRDIAKIDTIYYAGATYSPYMSIERNNGSSFKVSVNGTKDEISHFFNEAIYKWRQAKKP